MSKPKTPTASGISRLLASAALLAVTALTVTACSLATDPYLRNPADAAACRAFKISAEQGAGPASVYAIIAGMNAQSGELGNLITASFDRYGSDVAVIDWCNNHGYPVAVPGQ